MTPFALLIDLVKAGLEYLKDERYDIARQTLLKLGFELEKRKECEEYNIAELKKARDEIKGLERKVTTLTLENNKLKQSIVEEPNHA